MKRELRAGVIAAALLCGSPLATAEASTLTLSSPAIAPKSTLPKRFEADSFGCQGENQSPALHWQGAPAGTQSFAVTVYDPDAPTGSGWWHWMVINIPASVNQLADNAGEAGGKRLPDGARQLRIDYGVEAWGGVCPPPGDKPHRYIFTVYALKTPTLDIPKEANPALGGYMINANTLAKASFTAYYSRAAK
ncbi:YbhB/YbcL family Raf kinase inhibitor-like protein [Dickeya lacustris]|uniref:YbhB/YbcL family Raf kinase inhibitor-like protein n=1 Tax=Dickeya lacustris TaxID=2259638 RepID=A0ABY8GAW0_9GAMM|nr:YbhB/YbcL family Raf kinase inhibitor-like protein [Dickeya lacustris]WFN57014.1 YbhB/YbcL family Raf kinase inhibitor-like protein [Dickeya lacustris]